MTKNIIVATFVADTYSLGAHWVYDEQKLASLPIDWDTLNAPQAKWHSGKFKGEFTHYGDQSIILLEFLNTHESFDETVFYRFWEQEMETFPGYVDGATKNAIQAAGSPSTDLSICGRIALLLLCSKNREQFLENVTNLVRLTHNSELTHSASQFFGALLWDCRAGNSIGGSIQKLKNKHPDLADWIDKGVASNTSDTPKTIREFGAACDIKGGFAGAIHLLSLGENFETTMRKNAKAGGDSAARGTTVAMIMATQTGFTMPENWVREMKQIETVRTYLEVV